MHHDAANRVHASEAVFAGANAFREADLLGSLALEAELRRVLQHQNRAVRCAETFCRRLKVAAQDIGFIDTIVREKPICGLGTCPILTREGQALADRATDVG